jgi:hypothetical protein
MAQGNSYFSNAYKDVKINNGIKTIAGTTNKIKSYSNRVSANHSPKNSLGALSPVNKMITHTPTN